MSHNNNIEFVNTLFRVGGIGTEALPFNPKRRYLLIQNQTLTRVFLSFGNKASELKGIIIEGNGYYEPYVCPASSINFYSPTGANVMVIEGVERRGQ